METVIEKLVERILSRIDSALIVGVELDADHIDKLLDKAVKILEIYSRIIGV